MSDTASAPVASAPLPALDRPVRTRFAPSPTGYLHIGGARTALYAWAFARHHGGAFILRVEDTDRERSTDAATQAILGGMDWLGLKPDEGPFFQSQRMARYREVLEMLKASGHVYPCWMSVAELDALRDAQRSRGEKPRYDGRWRPERAQAAGLVPPADTAPVWRFRTPTEGVVGWKDLVKGALAIDNAELDDLVIARADGTPTYNFCVVVDDWDMDITHVIRGDDHVNNTPRQIHIFRALGAPVPVYGHLPMIHGPDGQKLSKRHGAVSVLQYDELGYLPEAVTNYLARLGWSHGDDELFTREQMVAWFDGSHLSSSASQLDFEKLRWVNTHYLRAMAPAALAAAVLPRLQSRLAALPAGRVTGQDLSVALPAWVALLRDRCATLEELADACLMLARRPDHTDPEWQGHWQRRIAVAGVADALQDLSTRLDAADGSVASVGAAIKATLAACGLKMPQLAMPVRLLVFGQEQTPSVDAMLAAMDRDEVRARLVSPQG